MKTDFAKLGVLLTTGCVTLLVGWFIVRTHAADAESKPIKNEWQRDPEYLQLLLEREKTASEVLQAERKQWDIGRATLDSVIFAANRLRDARLDLATTPEIAIRSEHLGLMRELEDLAKKTIGLRELVAPSIVTTRYWRLSAEIDLFRAKNTSASR